MRRRRLLLLLGAAITAGRGLRAQQTAKPVIGYLNGTSAQVNAALLAAFRQGLSETGWVEGQNLAIEYRWAEGQYDWLPAMAAELVRHPLDVIVATGGTLSGRAAEAATATVPIVVLTGGDPINEGFTNSLSHPSGNITGVAQLVTETASKRLQLLHDVAPGADTIGYLENPTLPHAQIETQTVQAAARALGVNLAVVTAGSARDIDAAFASLARERIAALIGSDPFFFMQRDQLVSLSQQNRVPTMYFFREFVTAGGLISYGTRLADGYRQIGTYTGKMLKGAKPADLPIAQQSERIELVVNLMTAKELGLTIPPSILARADEVIEWGASPRLWRSGSASRSRLLRKTRRVCRSWG
jgi:putative ABC transport system substrate-binding protein